MTIALIIGIGALLFVLSLLFYLYSERLLAREAGSAVADQATFVRESAQTDNGDAHLNFSDTERRIAVDRLLYTVYPQQIFAGEAFRLDVVIAAPGVEQVPAGTPPQVTSAGGRLRFKSAEPEPLLQVSLAFDERDFATQQASQRQRLDAEGETRFAFALRPLRAATAPIVVTVAHLTTIQEPAAEEQRVVVKKTTANRPPETTETITYAPARTVSAATTVKTVPLLIHVTSLLGLSENQVRFWQKALAPVVAVLLLALALATGRIGDLTEFAVLLVTVLANVVGVELFPEIRELFG